MLIQEQLPRFINPDEQAHLFPTSSLMQSSVISRNFMEEKLTNNFMKVHGYA